MILGLFVFIIVAPVVGIVNYTVKSIVYQPYYITSRIKNSLSKNENEKLIKRDMSNYFGVNFCNPNLQYSIGGELSGEGELLLKYKTDKSYSMSMSLCDHKGITFKAKAISINKLQKRLEYEYCNAVADYYYNSAKKNNLSLNITYNNKNSLAFACEHAQDNRFLLQSLISYKYKQNNPDRKVSLFLDYGVIKDKGALEDIRKSNYDMSKMAKKTLKYVRN
ncbi:hypothetical protein [Francisella sp. 19X1-34]|uniref:hypothetical protein n=1 Tax=Francisella sp. 19X1-34 TaxID=3087177 RepID=UPI002E362517|nr:hypothetical protein [Francisella sp. 19X1-34]